ncbi:MAG: HAMP domain-containing sensor histidine kinase [Kofleriaceae bacterium]
MSESEEYVQTLERRVAELELEVTASRRTIDVLVDRIERGTTDGATHPELFDAAIRMSQLVEEQAREVEQSRAELAAAEAEFRALKANLDQIVRQRTLALEESEKKARAQNAELERQSVAKADFIGQVAHELRTPLTSIVGYLDLFAEERFGKPPAQMSRPLNTVRRNALRLRRFVEEMLDHRRMEAGKIELERAPVQLGDVVSDVVSELSQEAKKRGQTMICQIDTVEPIMADRDRLHQVIVNLVHNAIKYTRAEGEIRIVVEQAELPGGWIRLRVRDNGNGIPLDQQARIFEPFSTLHPVKYHSSSDVGRPASAGLGLSIARGLVELHGGIISVESTPGEFAEFVVLLPLRPSET